jgi:hypothetical protein
LRILVAIVGILIGLTGLGIDFWFIVPPSMAPNSLAPDGRSLPDALIYFWTFFTHLTNLGLLLAYAAELTRWPWLGWFRRPRTQALVAAYILLVMLYYHFMLAPYYDFEGPLLVATILLHYVAPITYLAWWAALTSHGALRLGDMPWMLVPGVAYVLWALGRGAMVREYPYDILDAGKYGYGQVAASVAVLTAAVAIFSLLLILADSLLGRLARS